MFTKPLYQKLKSKDKSPILFMVEEQSHFSVPWHFHPEVEILLVQKSSGILYVGDGIINFEEGDVAIIGENTPHWWKSSDEDCELKGESMIIQFPKEVFVGKGNMLPYMGHISDFILKSERGVWFKGEAKKRMRSLINELFTVEGVQRTTKLILLLDEMSRATQFSYLSEVRGRSSANISDFERFNKVYGYIIHHFRRRITLEEVSRLAKISPTAFCRYFKSHTGKTLASFINEFRIDHACKLLAGSDAPVAKIARDCGFNNISNFNEQFRKLMNTTPIKYRKQFSSSSSGDVKQ